MSSVRDKNIKPFVMVLFGGAVIASGVWRYVSAEGGQTGLAFGLVMGSLALSSATWFLLKKNTVASVIGWLSILLVGGWFIYESFVKKGIANAEPRQLVIIGVTLFTALVLFVNRDGRSPDGDAG